VKNIWLLQQEETARTWEAAENNSLMQKPDAVSGYLKSIKVKCEEIDARVCKVLKFLSILDMEIIIKRTNRWSDKCKLIIYYLPAFRTILLFRKPFI
jgi:hypothetical protein